MSRACVRRTATALLCAATAAAAVSWGAAVAVESPTPAEQEVNPAEAIAPLVQPSVVYLAIEWSGYVYDNDVDDWVGEFGSNGAEPKRFTATSRCTGFVVNPDGWIATADHCVDPRFGKISLRRAAIRWALDYGYYVDTATFKSLDEFQDYTTYTVQSLDGDQQTERNSVDRVVTAAWGAAVSGVEITESTPARVDAQRKYEDGDVALLKVDASGLNALPLDDADAEINDQVQSVGYPGLIDNFTDFNLVPTFNPGTVSSQKTFADGLLPVLQLTAPIRGGMSGGPTVNLDGEIVGINSRKFDGEPFNYAVPVDQLRQLMNGAGVPNELSEVTRAYRSGVLATLAGDKPTAVRNLRLVVREQPANGLAVEFLDRARDLPDPPRPPAPAAESSSLVWWLVALGAVLAALGIGGGLWWRRSRTAAGPSSTPVPAAAAEPAPGPPGGTVGIAGAPPVEGTAPVGFVPSSPDHSPTTSAATGAGAQPEPISTATLADPVPAQPVADHRFCTSCGTEASSPAMRFCGNCGEHL